MLRIAGLGAAIFLAALVIEEKTGLTDSAEKMPRDLRKVFAD